MAFCSKCGTELTEGAKFCPKCGQAANGNETSSFQSSVTDNSYSNEPEEEQIKTWQKIVSVLFWPAGAVLIIASLIKKQSELAKSALIYTAIGIGLAIAINVSLGGCSNDVLEAAEEEFVDSETSDVEEVGYNAGYEFGFTVGEGMGDGSETAGQSFQMQYGTPSTPEEKQLFQKYKNAYMRGYKDGSKANN